jgi:hypothetical protein
MVVTAVEAFVLLKFEWCYRSSKVATEMAYKIGTGVIPRLYLGVGPMFHATFVYFSLYH